MRFARSFLALAALCAAAACADGASRITAPTDRSHDETAVGGGWVGSDNVTENGGGWIGSGNNTPPADTTDNGFGGTWIGSGN
ncbi:MAG TPA: hypothetical protein VF710_18175 [Longimicrobium sp.]|jgi:hypothetical protein